MRRLVYSPTIHAYIKTDEGVVDISPWIVSGSVNRKIDQVSTAQITLRNPIKGDGPELLWTDHVRTVDGKTGPRFHPMDPIVIVMTRLKGYPVPVFTGYLDKTPYLQFFPGLCTIEASCTLKRLLYTQWDAALPFIQYFLSQYGWIPDGDTGTTYNANAETAKLKQEAGKLQGQFNDGSIGALLFAVLNSIGEWDSNTIWIEALPPQIKDDVIQLYNQTRPLIDKDRERFKGLLSQILNSLPQGTGNPGAPSSGSSGGTGSTGSTGTIAGASRIIPTMVKIANNHGVPPLFVVATWIAETGGNVDCSPNSANAIGYFQFTSASPYPGVTVNYPKDACDLGIATNAFCQYAAVVNRSGASRGICGSIAPGAANNQAQWELWAEVVQCPGVGSYSNRWGSCVSQAQGLINQYGGAGTTHSTMALATSPSPSAQTPSAQVQTNVAGTSPGGRSGSGSGGTNATGSMTRLQAMIEAANVIMAKNYPYAWGGGHLKVGQPNRDIRGGSAFGFDCSGAVSAVLSAAGVVTSPQSTYTIVGTLGSLLHPGVDTSPGAVNLFVKTADHVFMQIDGHYFGTSGSYPTDPAHGAGWFQATPTSSYLAGFAQYHFDHSYLNAMIVYNFALGTGDNTHAGGAGGGPGSTGGAGAASGGSGTSPRDAVAAAFSTMINLPSIFAQAEALCFTGRRSFIADQPLFPFVQQLCQASMRSFMSMPNGNFFAFFPDYFGLYGRNYYWEIQDIELIDGRIDLSDSPLVTHVAVAGDVTQFHQTVDVFDLLMTSGIFTIFDAFSTGFVGQVQDRTASLKGGATFSAGSAQKNRPDKKKTATEAQINPSDKKAALAFLQKYGARPYVEQVPAIRSPFFELFFAFQKFMLLWAKQFQTVFEFTFMPELFPGGIIAFPTHHVQCYVEEVIHHWDYEQGFTTTANLSAPSIITGDSDSRPNVSEGLARPLP